MLAQRLEFPQFRGRTIDARAVFTFIGAVPRTNWLADCVQTDAKGFIKVNARQQTEDPAIYAIGDIAGGVLLAHKASKEARIAVEVIVGEDSAFADVTIPAVVFTDPELAWCGLTEAEARDGSDFGDDRLVATVLAHRDLSPWRMVDAIVDRVSDFTGGVFRDDATLLAVAIR